MSKKDATFITDLDFCPDCGTVLPLPGHEDVVTCKLCNYQIDVRGMYIVSLSYQCHHSLPRLEDLD